MVICAAQPAGPLDFGKRPNIAPKFVGSAHATEVDQRRCCQCAFYQEYFGIPAFMAAALSLRAIPIYEIAAPKTRCCTKKRVPLSLELTSVPNLFDSRRDSIRAADLSFRANLLFEFAEILARIANYGKFCKSLFFAALFRVHLRYRKQRHLLSTRVSLHS